MAYDIPTKMRACVARRPGDKYYSLEEQPVPKPRGYHCLLKIGAAGLCHTDLMVLSGEFGGNLPHSGSHEPAGTVVALGEEAEKLGTVKIGDRVAALLPIDVCYQCKDCTEGDWKYCPNSKYTGATADGAFAEYEILDARHLAPLPYDMRFEQAAPLTCAGVTIYSAIKLAEKRANLKPGDVVLISGLGALGYLGIQMARVMGFKVVGVDARPEAVQLAKDAKFPPDLTVDATKSSVDQVREEINKLRPEGYRGFGGTCDGADAVILTADAKPAQRYAADLTIRHGLFVIVAQPPTIEFQYTDFIFKDLTVVGSLHGNTEDLKETIALCAKHGIKSEVVPFSIEQHKEMLDSVRADSRKGKSVMVF